jgi:hypothetical protein
MNREASLVLGVLLGLAASALQLRAAPIIWNGPLTSFTKPNFGNPALAANQDRLTSDIWLTRSSSFGLYNANTEAGFSHFFSPAGTEWANGSLANYASLTYTDWNSWAKGINAGPPSTVGINAVVHLIPDDIYLSVRFTSWTASGAGGGFSYLRSTPVPEPSVALVVIGGLAVLCAARRLRT